MTIAINTVIFQKNQPENKIAFRKEIFLHIAKENPGHQFIFITDDAHIEPITSGKNVLIINNKKLNNALASFRWQQYQLPAIIKKYSVDVVISINCSYAIKTNIVQYLLIDNLSIVNKKNIAVFDTVEKIFTSSEYIKSAICQLSKSTEQKTTILYAAADQRYQPADWAEKQETLNKYSNDKEYFLFNDVANNDTILITQLKAFSLFKKWQKSNMQLIIATRKTALTSSFTEMIKNYKYKDAVIILTNVDENVLTKIYPAAYALISLTDNKDYSPLLQAMQSDVPVIAAKNVLNEEICGDAALYTNANDIEDISQKMILIYKDENRRNELIKKGAAQSKKYPLANTLDPFKRLLT